MGTKGASGTRKLLFGSLTTETILDSPVPVLVIPKARTHSDFNQIVFATDYGRDDLEKVREIVEFARLFDASLRIVHVARFDNMETDIRFTGFKELVLREHPGMDIAFDLIYEDDFFAGIADYLQTHAVDLLTMVRYKKSFWESMTTRRYSKELGFYTQVPLMVLMSRSED
ncbi:MAG: universal stress protein [Balneolaceae bacterium]|nr:universal stress protein [Balneolaceae bacterium]